MEDSYGLIELADRVQQENVVRICGISLLPLSLLFVITKSLLLRSVFCCLSEEMMHRNLTNETALKILMVASEYELIKLKKESLQLIKREAPTILKRSELRTLLSQWPWNLIDIIRTLVKVGDFDLSDDETQDNAIESEDDNDDDENGSTELQ